VEENGAGSRKISTALVALAAFGFGSFVSGCAAEVVNRSASPTLVASSSLINLGNVSLGKSVGGTVSLVNTGPVPINLTQLSVKAVPFQAREHFREPARLDGSRLDYSESILHLEERRLKVFVRKDGQQSRKRQS